MEEYSNCDGKKRICALVIAEIHTEEDSANCITLFANLIKTDKKKKFRISV